MSCTFYNCSRKAGSKVGEAKKAPWSKVQNKIEFDIKGKKYFAEKATLQKTFNEVSGYYGLYFSKESKWYGTVSPYMAIFNAHKHRMQEVKFGLSSYYDAKLGKTNPSENFANIKALSFDRHHSIMFEGMRYPPEARSSICKSMGLMTNIYAMKDANDMYKQKYEKAVMEAMQHLPQPASVINVINMTQKSALSVAMVQICELAM